MKDLLLITPPFTQLNTAYPATAQLKGFLQLQGFEVAQMDLGIETLLDVFTSKGLNAIFDQVESNGERHSAATKRILKLRDNYSEIIEPVIEFLQGKDNTMAYALSKDALPRGSRFDNIPDQQWLFGTLGMHDQAKYLSTLFLEDLGDFIQQNLDEHFGFSRYAEHIGVNAIDFDPLEEAVQPDSLITQMMYRILDLRIQETQPKVIGLSVPFPGNLLTALKVGKFVKENNPNIQLVLGGGYANTELRSLKEKRFFNYFDYVCLDDGERSLLQLLKVLLKDENQDNLVRTFLFQDNQIQYINNTSLTDISHGDIGIPDYDGLFTDKYISVLEMANPMHRMWSDGRWNKMFLAHGCYWHNCSFCDTSLDYIKRYSQASATILCDRIEAIIEQTGQRGFHFVDEAAPPKVVKDLAIELIKRKIKITWWTNIRFEKSFTQDLCVLLAKSGCIAVTGGLEVASDRLLQMMHKGVSIEQVTHVTDNFQHAGIMVHAYLMYGFPTQSDQETIDSLEVVRQLFENDLLQSAFWHRFVMTVHSPVGINPELYNVERLGPKEDSFAKNDAPHHDPSGCDHEKYGFGLKKALYNFMHGMCFDYEMQDWFDFRVPRTQIPHTLIQQYLAHKRKAKPDDRSICLWLGLEPAVLKAKKNKLRLLFEKKSYEYHIELPKVEADWLIKIFPQISVSSESKLTFEQVKLSYEEQTGLDFKAFLKSKSWRILKENDLLIL